MKQSEIDNFSPLIYLITGVLVICMIAFTYLLAGDQFQSFFEKPSLITKKKPLRSRINEVDDDRVVDGIHLQTGLAYGKGFDMVRGTCTACHSAKLVTQNRATRAGWQQMIHWMQATQGLWDLGENEPVILDYLAKYYAPKNTGRRANINVKEIEWFILELDD